jgi:hypothetical protein
MIQKPIVLNNGKKEVLQGGDILEGPFIIPYFHIIDSTIVTTTSATDVLLVGAQFVSPPAGQYMATVNLFTSLGNQNTNLTISLYVGGVLVPDSSRVLSRGGNQFPAGFRLLYTLNTPINVDGSQNVEIRWRRSAGTATKHEIDFTIMRVA